MVKSVDQKLRDKLHSLPTSSGVYRMLDMGGNLLYVGKAQNLRKRVGSYFQRDHLKDPKTAQLVERIVDFDVILLANEAEALLLERSLIKEHKPPFNILLQDDKQ